MERLLLSLAALLGAIGFALVAQANLIQFGTGGGGGGYSGPGDQASFTSFYSFRCFSAAKATGTTKVVQLTRASDSTTQDEVCLSNGNFDTATATTFCNATTCSGFFYDQVTTNDLSNNVSSAFPAFTLNCINTNLPCWKGNSATQFMRSAANYTPGQANVSMYGVADRVNGTEITPIIEENGGNSLLTTTASVNTWRMVGGSTGICVNATASDNAAHLAIGLITGDASASLTIDGGTAVTGSCVGNTTAGRITTINGVVDATDVTEIMEIGFLDNATVWTAGQLTNLHTNASAYWGTP